MRRWLMLVLLADLSVACAVAVPALPPTEPAAPANGTTEGQAGRPNVLLVTMDALRADHLASYGGRVRSPSVDRLAAEGVRFANAYTQEPQTNPGHASLFTGQYPSTHGVRVHMHTKLPPAAATLAEVLASQGYRTAGLYSWFSLDSEISGFEQGFQTYRNLNVRAGTREVLPEGSVTRAWRRGEDVEGTVDGRADVTTDAAIRWLEETARDRARPFFLWLHYMEPHHPYVAPAPYDTLYGPRCANGVDGSLATLRRLGGGWWPTPAEVECIVAAYDGEITFADAELGRLLARLDGLQLAPRTLVVFMADHGEAFGESGEWFHGGKLHQPTVRIPLLMRLPGVLPPGTTVRAVAQSIDVMPTVLDLVGAPAPSSVEGNTLRPAIAGDGSTERVAIAEVADWQYSAVIDEEWKLVQDNMSGDRWLHHLPTDPAETTNRLTSDPTPAEALGAILDAWFATRSAGTLWRGPTGAVP